MKGTVKLSKEQKAGARALIKQYEKNFAHPFFEYLPIEGHKVFLENGVTLTIPDQLKILKELGGMGLGVQIDFLGNDLDPETGCLTDALHNECCPGDDPDEEEQEAYQAKLSYGTIMVVVEKGAMERLSALCEEYYCELEFLDETNYIVKCFSGRHLNKVYRFPALQKGKRPQIIIALAMGYEGKPLNKKTLNKRLNTKGATNIAEHESVRSSVFAHEKASLAVLSYFFDIESDSITYNGPIAESLDREDIGVLEKYCKTNKR